MKAPSCQTSPIRRHGLQLLIGAVVTVAVSLSAATPANADPARPTNYRSTVASVKPPSQQVRLKVVGGDGFLDLDVDRGHTVEIEGYRGEPYLRVRNDGTVQENTNSPATYLNKTRFARTTVPAPLLADDLPAPVWRTIGHKGHAVWHDHRIHFMGSDPSQINGLAQGRPVAWTVALKIDGAPTVASGSYRLLPAPSPLPWLVLAAVLAALLIWLGPRSPVLASAVAVTVAGALGTVVGWEQNAAIPAGAGATPITVALPLLAFVAGLIAIAKRATPPGVIAVLAGVALSGGWFITRSSVLWKSILPTVLAPGLDRATMAIVLGLSVGSAVLAIRSGALSPANLQEDEATTHGP